MREVEFEIVKVSFEDSPSITSAKIWDTTLLDEIILEDREEIRKE